MIVREIQEPESVQSKGVGGDKEEKLTHPAYAQLSITRVSGGTNLYGSDFTHQRSVEINLHKSELHRSLSSDWYYQAEKILSLSMTEAQWATFVSSIGVGGGVPCTVDYMQGIGHLPRLPEPKSRTDQFSGEMQTNFTDAVSTLDELANMVSASGMSKKKIADLQEKIRKARSNVSSSSKFVAEQFDKHMEKQLERAKVEIHGFASQLLNKHGIAALVEKPEITLLTNDQEDK